MRRMSLETCSDNGVFYELTVINGIVDRTLFLEDVRIFIEGFPEPLSTFGNMLKQPAILARAPGKVKP